MRQRLPRPTPFFVISLLCLLYLLFEFITSGGTTEGWLYRMGKMLLPLVAFMVISDLLLKYFITSVRKIVVAELVLFLAIAYYWVVS